MACPALFIDLGRSWEGGPETGGEMTKNYPPSRNYLLTTASALWCPICKAIRDVTDYFGGGTDEVKLECSHRRPWELK